jgi:sulfur-oxidizing protein SoxA
VKRLCFLIGLLVAPALPAAEIPLAERQSSYAIMAPETRAMQDDDTANPGMFWVLDGEALWSRKAGETQKSCADCHGDAPAAMRGVSARYPAFDAARARAVNIEQRVNLCRVEHQRAPALGYESKELLALTSFLARHSKGAPISPPQDPQAMDIIARGRELFSRRQGQLNLSCAICHDDNRGGKLAGASIPQAHPTAYPAYRLEWQTMGSLQRRLRNCLTGMRAEAPPLGSDDLVALETFLMWRARGMPHEGPGVRP